METAIPVLVLGRSSSGKTYSMKTFKPGEVGVISVEKGRLPFKSDIKVIKVKKFDNADMSPAQANVARYQWIKLMIKESKAKSIVIDDSQYLLVNELEAPDKIVYFLHHSELDADGREKVKTIGKMLDEKLCIEGCFDIVLYCQDQKFFTQANGQSVAKTPEGMFESVEIPNDLKFVDTSIREYYGMAKNEVEEDKA